MGGKKKQIKLDKVFDDNSAKGVVAQQITSDFVLEIYEQAKSLKGKEKKDMLVAAEVLSKNIGSWVVK